MMRKPYPLPANNVALGYQSLTPLVTKAPPSGNQQRCTISCRRPAVIILIVYQNNNKLFLPYYVQFNSVQILIPSIIIFKVQFKRPNYLARFYRFQQHFQYFTLFV